MPENRNPNNYQLQTAPVTNPTGGTDNIIQTLTFISLDNQRFNPVFEGWNSLDSFVSYSVPNDFFRRGFNPLLAEFNEIQMQDIAEIRSAVLAALDLDEAKFEFQNFHFDIKTLRGHLSAFHKTNPSEFVFRYIQTDQHFGLLKAQNAEMFEKVEDFAWELGKANDSFLNSLTRITN